MTTTLSLSSIPDEYKLSGNGHNLLHLQYKVSVDELCQLDTCSTCTVADARGFVLAEHSIENKRRVIPDTNYSNDQEWNLILLMKKMTDDGSIWMKAALQNKATNDIALMTSTNNMSILNRPIKSHDDDWFIGHYGMSAPMIFWEELANRLKN